MTNVEAVQPEPTGTSRRTLVDDFVKSAMLRHFSLLPTRKHVLVSLFFTVGNGYVWDRDAQGLAVPASNWPYAKEARIPSHEEVHGIDKSLLGDAQYLAADAADTEFQNMVRDWARRNIDAISTRWFHFYDLRLPHPEPYEACLNNSLLAELPDNVHPDWVDAISETCDAVAVHINQKTMAHAFDDEDKRQDHIQSKHSRYWEPYMLVKKTVARLEDYPVIRERRELASQIISEILGEEKAA